jgi:tRNA threonylcarbamoyladenosine biosynthesis protein TsaB
MILAIDTSTQWVGIAIHDGAVIQYEKVWKSNRRHTIELAPNIQSAFSDCGISPKDLSAVAVALGPGSFTSLRIGLATAKGFCLSQMIPIIGIPTLDIIAFSQPLHDLPMICLLKAGRSRLAVVRYEIRDDRWQAVNEPVSTTAEEIEKSIIAPTWICGEIDALDRQVISRRWRNARIAQPAGSLRRPSYLAEMAWDRFRHSEWDDVLLLAPIYLHTIDAIEPG